jgi:hypothetical protein
MENEKIIEEDQDKSMNMHLEFKIDNNSTNEENNEIKGTLLFNKDEDGLLEIDDQVREKLNDLIKLAEISIMDKNNEESTISNDNSETQAHINEILDEVIEIEPPTVTVLTHDENDINRDAPPNYSPFISYGSSDQMELNKSEQDQQQLQPAANKDHLSNMAVDNNTSDEKNRVNNNTSFVTANESLSISIVMNLDSSSVSNKNDELISPQKFQNSSSYTHMKHLIKDTSVMFNQSKI